MWGYCRAGEATDDNMTHVNCTLDTYGYKHLLSKYGIQYLLIFHGDNFFTISPQYYIIRTWYVFFFRTKAIKLALIQPKFLSL
jgi:hypothetical protein